MARPKIDNPRAVPLQIRWTERDLESIERAAQVLECSVSEFIRGAAVKDAIAIGGFFNLVRSEKVGKYHTVRLLRGVGKEDYILIDSLEDYPEARHTKTISQKLGRQMAAATTEEFRQLFYMWGCP